MTQWNTSKAYFKSYVFGIMAGAALILWHGIVFHIQRASLLWPTVSGTILQSERVYVSGRNSYYRADVTYGYKVNGTNYTSHRISLWSRDLSSFDSINGVFVENHPQGSAVDVYYDPARPEHAVLIPGPDRNFNEFGMGGGALVIVIGIFGIVRQIPRKRRMIELSNAPDATARTMHLRVSDIKKASNVFWGNAGIAFLLAISGTALLLGPWLINPPVLLEAPRSNSTGLVISGVVCLVAAVFFVICALRKGRKAECPLCGTLLWDAALSTSICPGCKPPIIFEDQSASANSATAKIKDATSSAQLESVKSSRHHSIAFGTRKDRFIDVSGLVISPIIFVWLWVGSEEHHNPGIAIILTVVFSMAAGLFYFFPEKAGSRKIHHAKKGMEPEDGKPGPYLVDFSIILSAPVGLLFYLLYLTWQHQVLGVAGLIGVVVGFPIAVGIVTYLCKQRFARAKKLNLPKSPSFVPLTLLALWLVGTFIWIVFVVCLVGRLTSNS